MPTTTVGDLFELYMDLHARPFTKSWRNTEDYWRRHCRTRWGSVAVQDVTKLQIQRWVAELAEVSGKPTANRSLTVLASVLNWADKNDYIRLTHNPCRGVRMFRAEYRERFLQPSEIERFLTALELIEPDMKDVFWMLLLTGARKSNVFGMKWEDISLDQKYWRIPAALTKNSDSQLIPLGPKAMQVLTARMENRVNSWVFPGRSTDGHIRCPNRAWRKILANSGLENLTIHDLRRTVGSYMAINGASPYIIGAALGHKDSRSTAIYARLNLQPVREAFEQVQEKWLMGNVRASDEK